MKKTQKTHKVLTAIIALIAAVCMWVYVAPDGETEYRNLPVTFENTDSLEDYSLMLDMDIEPTVNITVYGRRSELLSLDRDDITVTVDLGKIKEEGEYQLTYSVELPSSRTSSMEVSEYLTDVVTVQVVRRVSKTIEVKGIWNGEVAEGDYLAEQIVVDPAELVIYGPQELVDTISYAQVQLERTNLDKTVSEDLEYTLVNYDGEPVYSSKIYSDVDTIRTTQPIVMTKELPLKVTLVDGAGATSDYAVVEYEPASITISGDQTTLDGVSSIDLGTIDLGDVIDAREYEFPILIPNDAKNLSEVTEATVTVTIKGLETAQYRISKDSFETINVPEGYDVSFLNQYLQVEVRATPEAQAAIQSNNIRVVADLSGVTGVGRQEIPVEVYVDGYTDAGALGDYTVIVTVTEHVEETEEQTDDDTQPYAEGASSADGIDGA
jgi:YbbR domain-containing protein